MTSQKRTTSRKTEVPSLVCIVPPGAQASRVPASHSLSQPQHGGLGLGVMTFNLEIMAQIALLLALNSIEIFRK